MLLSSPPMYGCCLQRPTTFRFKVVVFECVATSRAVATVKENAARTAVRIAESGVDIDGKLRKSFLDDRGLFHLFVNRSRPICLKIR